MKNIKYLFMIFLLCFSIFSYNVNAVETEESFSIKEIKPIAYNKVELIFNANLEDIEDASREFKIVNRVDSSDELEVKETELDEEDKKILYVTFTSNAKVNWEYELTVIDLKDEKWRNIKDWIEWIAFFVMPEKFDTNTVSNSNNTVKSNIIDENEETDWIDLNAWWPSAWDNPSLDWKTIDESQVAKTAESEAKKSDKLPQTWPEVLFILILSLIMGSLYFGFKLKRS